MNGLLLLIGIGIVCFILVCLSYSFDNEHKVIKIGLLLFVMFLLTLIPKVLVDESSRCQVEINSTTTIGNTTSYTYLSTCNPDTSNTRTTLFKSVQRVLLLLVTYFFVYIAYTFLSKTEKFKRVMGKI